MEHPVYGNERPVAPHIAAKHFGVDRITIYRWLKKGILYGEKIGGVIRIYLSSYRKKVKTYN